MQGFDPDRDLVRIGLANQTTMLRDETLSIGKMLEKTMMQKYGPAELKQHYMVMDTICDATQVRPCTFFYCARAFCSLLPAQRQPGAGMSSELPCLSKTAPEQARTVLFSRRLVDMPAQALRLISIESAGVLCPSCECSAETADNCACQVHPNAEALVWLRAGEAGCSDRAGGQAV